MHYGERIRQLREDYGINQSELAEAIGKKRNTISGYEASPDCPPVAVVEKICKFLEMPLYKFFMTEEDENYTPLEHEVLISEISKMPDYYQRMAIKVLNGVADAYEDDLRHNRALIERMEEKGWVKKSNNDQDVSERSLFEEEEE